MNRRLPPLSLYVHLPWCVRKCPYCDFNSHALKGELAEPAYVDALLRDLEYAADGVSGRALQTVFFGGGTPSLFSAAAIGRILEGAARGVGIAADAEITLEANPGTVDPDKLQALLAAGVNRLSLGIQSFGDAQLQRIGRIHDGEAAHAAIRATIQAGFDNFSLDLMFGLPGQSVADSIADVRAALDYSPSHLSFYQLTLEPGTPFHHRPPALPSEDETETMQLAGIEAMADAGLGRYEVSNFARADRPCHHNLNYWTYGDYLGIGAGAHGKLTRERAIQRTARVSDPVHYLHTAGGGQSVVSTRTVTDEDQVFEFLLNGLRLQDGVTMELFAERTFVSEATLTQRIADARQRGWLEQSDGRIRTTPLGSRFLDTVIASLLPETV